MADPEISNGPKDGCLGCGAGVAGGRTGCQRLFDEVVAREFGYYRGGKIHRLTVDAYRLQHPEEYMRSGKSFAAHLTGLCAAIEFEDSLEINRVVQKWLSRNPVIDKPASLPDRRGDLTIIYIHRAANAEEHTKRVREWAHAVWSAWAEHHDLARQLISKATTETAKH
jgi:hypothetical protein